MEPVTHVLTGACISRTGLNRYSGYATLTMAIAAEFPDIDTLWGLQGPVAAFQHHRGITHTLLGLPVEAAIVVGAIYCLHRVRLARALSSSPGSQQSGATSRHSSTDSQSRPRPLTIIPPRWLVLYGLALLALLSHLLLDYTNNYGLRPFFPFDPHWYAASIVFIFDPLIFAILLLALLAPAIFRLVGSEVGARRQRFAPRGWSWVALTAVVAIWGGRAAEHNRAVQLAMAESFTAPTATGGSDSASGMPPSGNDAKQDSPVFLAPIRVLASPDPLSPFRWYTVTDFGPLYQLGEADTRTGALVNIEGIYSKPGRTPEVLAAEESPLGRAYMDWSALPIITFSPGAAEDSATSSGSKVVTFEDPRFMGNMSSLRRGNQPPLTGIVRLDGRNQVISEEMDGRVQR